ncbi:MAG: DUF255 domain-containing protein [Cytophagales bacterium]
MKKYIFLTFLSLMACKQGSVIHKDTTQLVKWYTYEQMLEQQKISPKNIIIDVQTDWCGVCRVMEKKVYNNPVIAQKLNQNFYVVQLDAESNHKIVFQGKKISEKKLSEKFKIDAVPQTIFLNAKEDTLFGPIIGYIDSLRYEHMFKFIEEKAYQNTKFRPYSKAILTQDSIAKGLK